MAAIDIIGTNYDTLKTTRRQKEEEARVRIGHEMEALRAEFDALVWRAKEEGSSISKIALKMGASRSLVYQILDRAEVVAVREPLVVDPYAERIVKNADDENWTVTAPNGDHFQVTPAGDLFSTTHPGPSGKSWDVEFDHFATDAYKAWFYPNRPAILDYMKESHK